MKIKMNKTKGIIAFIISLAVLAFAGYVIMFGIGDRGQAKYITQGLDLKGGVSITYQVAESDKSNLTADTLEKTRAKLEKRIAAFSTEATAYKAGEDRITVEIPGAYDADEVLDELGKPGILYFCTAAKSGYTPTKAELKNKKYIKVDKSYYQVWLTGDTVASAEGQATTNDKGVNENIVSLQFNSEGTKAFGEMTSSHVGEQSFIIYDDEVLSAPKIQAAITGGQAQITGMSSVEEAQNLASYIRIGSLSIELEELRSSVVAAQLGEEAIATSVKAGAIGLVIVMLIMIIAYRIPGLVASVALVLYTTLMLITLNAFDITLTLPGIAGIILGIGMAVDANVIIYARIREEIAAGLSVHAAIKSGFGKAFSAIFDGNITTLIAACVLMWLGSGSVKGFAYTLAMGIVISMFTALVISRLVINAVYAIGVRDPKFYGIAKERKVVDFVGKRKIFFAVSIILILCGPVGMLVHSNVIGDKAMNYSLEFSGGTSTNVTFNKEMDIKEIDSEVTPVVEAVTGDKNVQPTKVQGTNQVVIKTRSLDLKEREALNKALEENFDVDTSLITSENISATVSNEMRRDAIVAVIVAAIFMLLYIWFRFKDIRFASSAVLALLHDVLVVLAFYVISRTSVGNTFIACMLTIVGYSINATIVIFDRIRENMRGRKKVEDEKLKEIVNTSVTETLTRSIYTSLTTFVMVAILYVMGVSSIKEFAAPLMVGIIGGAYSSVCITGALWYTMKTFRKNRVAAPAAAAASAKISSEKSEKKVKQPSGQQTAQQQPKKKNRKRVAERLAAQEAATQQNDEEKSE